MSIFDKSKKNPYHPILIGKMKSMNINIIHKLESLEADWKKIQTQIHSPPHTTTQDPKEIMQSLIEQQLKGVHIHVREIMSDE